MAYRPFPAGPLTPVEGLQMRGQAGTLRYALALDCDDPYALADDVLLPLEVVPSLGGGTGRRRAPSSPSTAPRSVRSTGWAGCSSSGSSTRPRESTVGLDPGALGLAGRPARLPARALRGLVRATTLRDRHRPAARRLTRAPGWRSSRRSPTPRSSSRSRRTSEIRSQRTLRRRSAAAPVPSASWPARPHHHSCTRPRSFEQPRPQGLGRELVRRLLPSAPCGTRRTSGPSRDCRC